MYVPEDDYDLELDPTPAFAVEFTFLIKNTFICIKVIFMPQKLENKAFVRYHKLASKYTYFKYLLEINVACRIKHHNLIH